jgi:hypothetical protein
MAAAAFATVSLPAGFLFCAVAFAGLAALVAVATHERR